VKTIDRTKIKMLVHREESRYVEERPKSQALFERAKASLLNGVPMSWMHRWAGPFPIFVKEANGARLTDVDDHRYLDLCLGDSGAMFGHSPAATVNAIMDRAGKGMTSMLPTEDCVWVGENLARRFGLPYWQIYMTATNANRFAIRVARQTTQRNLILVFDGCYHGSLDETLVNYRRERIMGKPPALALTTRVVQFNDIDAVQAALSPRDVACVICEPAMTDVGIIYPTPGYHAALREMTQHFGTLLIIDETHTLCAGPKGLTGAWNLEPDIFTLGKAVAGGFPAAVMGISSEVSERFLGGLTSREWDMGLGGTLSSNALAVAALRATLEHVMTDSAYAHMIQLAEQLEDGVDRTIKTASLPWHVIRLGCRVEYRFCPTSPQNGAEAINAYDLELDELAHLFFVNRGILLTPFHDMMLVCPETTTEDVDLHNKVFSEFVDELNR